MNLTIRQVTIDDLEVLIDWRITVLKEVFSDKKDTDYNALREENRKYYLNTVPSGGHVACFAMAGGEIIGCGGVCLYEEMPSPDNVNGKCGYLMNIYVKPDYRKQGAGKQIAAWLVEKAKERGVNKIYLETSDVAKNMYESLGFTEMQGYMKL